MLKFIPDSLKNQQELVYFTELGLFYNPEVIETIWRAYLVSAEAKKRVIGKPQYRKELGNINVIGIRNNPEISFNDKEVYYNDWLIIEKIAEPKNEIYLFKVTMDPRGRKQNIAHLLEGVYASYTALRPHKYVPGRTAIVQDRDSVLVARTLTDGKVSVKEHKGVFGINIHDSGGYQNSSLGCTVLESDSKENNYQFEQVFKPLIKSVTNKESIDYMVINKFVFKELVQRMTNYPFKATNIFNLAFRIPFTV